MCANELEYRPGYLGGNIERANRPARAVAAARSQLKDAVNETRKELAERTGKGALNETREEMAERIAAVYCLVETIHADLEADERRKRLERAPGCKRVPHDPKA